MMGICALFGKCLFYALLWWRSRYTTPRCCVGVGCAPRSRFLFDAQEKRNQIACHERDEWIIRQRKKIIARHSIGRCYFTASRTSYRERLTRGEGLPFQRRKDSRYGRRTLLVWRKLIWRHRTHRLRQFHPSHTCAGGLSLRQAQ